MASPQRSPFEPTSPAGTEKAPGDETAAFDAGITTDALATSGQPASLCEDQHRRWNAGERIRVEDYLARYPQLRTQPEQLVDLIFNEILLRRERGEDASEHEYLARFPEQAGALQVQRLAPIGERSDQTPEAARRPAPPLGVVVPGFEVLEVLGEGGMGIVYKARQQGLGRLVALKMIRPLRAGEQLSLERFRGEAEAVARLQHPHVVQVYAWGEHQGTPYFALEYCSGGSLQDCVGSRPQPPVDAARLVEKLARAVQAAHDQGIVHRDLKPANILLTPPTDEPALNTPWGVPKVADFGLCRSFTTDLQRTADGVLAGSPHYMAPEQARGQTRDVGPAADVWALGAILYRLLTGQPPFDGQSLPDILHKVCHDEPSRPTQRQVGVPAELEAICLKCLRKERKDRYARAADLAEALRGWLACEATAALPRPPSSARRARPWRRRALALMAVLLLAPLAGLTAWKAWPKPSPSAEVSPAPVSPAEVLAPEEPLKGFVDLQIYNENDPSRQDRWLGEPGILPLRAGDRFCIRAELDRPAYLYVLWIDADGKADLAYPRDPHTKKRPAREKPVQSLRQPEAVSRYYTIPAGSTGMETVVLLACKEPLPPEVDLVAELAGLPPQTRKGEAAVVWLRNGEVVHDEANRTPSWEETVVNDPLRQTQERLRQLWQKQGGYLRAVSFANRGR